MTCDDRTGCAKAHVPRVAIPITVAATLCVVSLFGADAGAGDAATFTALIGLVTAICAGIAVVITAWKRPTELEKEVAELKADNRTKDATIDRLRDRLESRGLHDPGTGDHAAIGNTPP